jgi:hypothetical protein
MAAAGTLIQMAAQRSSATALDGSQHTEMLPAQPGSILLYEAFARHTDDIGHLERWLIHLLCSLRERLTCSGAGQFEFVERRACGFQMALGEMKVNGSGFEVGVTEQQLYGR